MDISNLSDLLRIISFTAIPVIGYIYTLVIGVQRKVQEIEVENKNLELKLNDRFLKREDLNLVKASLDTQITNLETKIDKVEKKLDIEFGKLFELMLKQK